MHKIQGVGGEEGKQIQNQIQIPKQTATGTPATGKATRQRRSQTRKLQPKQHRRQEWLWGRFVTHEVFSDPPQRYLELYQ